MSTLLLLDGNSLTYRAFFALPADMSTASGQITNAVFGFTSMFINVLKDHRPDEVLVAFDRPEPTFRHEADADLQGQPRRRAGHPAPADGAGARGARRARRRDVRAGRLGGRRPHRHRHRAGRGARRRRHHRHRRPGRLPARRRPPRQGAVQPPRRQRLRAVRRGRHRRAHRRDAGAVPGVRLPTRRPERQPAGRAGRRREDGRQADQHVRRARRRVLPHRRTDAEAAGVAGRARGAHPQEPPGDGPAARRARRSARVAEDGAQPGGGQAAVRLPRVPDVRRPARRGAGAGRRRAVGRRAPAARRRDHRERIAGRRARRCSPRPTPSTSPRRGTASRGAPSCSGSPS